MNTSFQPRAKNKTAVNDITGNEIATHYNSTAYVNGWDLIWGDKKQETTKEEYDPNNFNPSTMDHPTIHTNRFFE